MTAKQSEKTGIGMPRDPNAHRKAMKRSRMRPVSIKQAKRNKGLRAKKIQLMALYVQMYGSVACSAGLQGWIGKCYGAIEMDHVTPRARTPIGVDNFSNLQLLCHAHHWTKTNKPGCGAMDFRSDRLKQECSRMDAETLDNQKGV